ncbi:alpha-(1,3)-fucosyltransferase c-like [Plakobranchus ocellatus]|uniref:Fucosyltransferase n=1 Tax=Plakobranchus ocellatus TaxID=259542 RepID=A0AAV4C475_9GAST|nr:alpha-(1,3)-fucosyltransferase c-like [Plakobranchus ocellatus]
MERAAEPVYVPVEALNVDTDLSVEILHQLDKTRFVQGLKRRSFIKLPKKGNISQCKKLKRNETLVNSRSEKSNKRMMYANPYPDAKSRLNFDFCEYSACNMTTSVEEADVILLNAGRMRDFQLPPRRPGQIWVMFSKEPPDLPRYDHLDRPDLINQCNRPSRRMEYVQRMRRAVDVHIYGRCGNLTCGGNGYEMGEKKKDCLNLLSRNYKFYLAFENTFCRDYVSEKFFNMFEDVDVIPVVRGGADYKRLFPAGIFIDASDFVSPESLGNYLHDLARDGMKYVALLKEKSRYVKSGYETNFPCDLCKIAHTGQPRHVYENFYKWLRAPGNCWSPRDLGPVPVDD